MWLRGFMAAMALAAALATPQRARAHLLVTVPLYMAWFESESGK